MVTADHGNAEQMLEPDGKTSTAHSLNPVPLIVTARGLTLLGEGTLADVAPTVLALLGMQRPPAMSGRSLVRRDAERCLAPGGQASDRFLSVQH